jgi:hypothetical protein
MAIHGGLPERGCAQAAAGTIGGARFRFRRAGRFAQQARRCGGHIEREGQAPARFGRIHLIAAMA